MSTTKKVKTIDPDTFIKENWEKMTDRQIAENLDVTVYAVTKKRYALGLKHRSVANKEIDADLEKARLKAEEQADKKRYQTLLTRLATVEKERDAALQLKRKPTIIKIDPNYPQETSEATAFLVLSDWHVGESVRLGDVNGMNEYNLEIAQKRAEDFFKNGRRLLGICQKDITIETMVLALLGDFTTGNIHMELVENGLLSPIEAMIFVQNLLASGIKFLLKETDLKTILIPCHSGNHARITQDRRISTEKGNSLEYMMYHQLANIFANEPRVQFLIAEGYHSYLDVYGYKVRFHHGHQIKFQGGIGGITISVNKAIAQWNKGRQADFDVFGHFHQRFDGGNFLCNGSGVGYNAFALSIKASFEKPQQSFLLLDKERGKTIVAPILTDH